MRKKYRNILIAILALPVLLIFICNLTIEWYSADKTFSDMENIPKNKVGLVLGDCKPIGKRRGEPILRHTG